ncbi:MAG TPA: FAD binding domain-containing protein [Solirubrobacteraceae bacterium]|jgi:CO/xanthine dehydrogenase FAD-binding subunit
MAVSLDTEVVVATSAQEAREAFGDGDGVTVVAGGTIVMPDITHRRLVPKKAVLIGKAGLAGVSDEGGRTTIGATTSVADLQDLAEPIGSTAQHVADPEIRRQATVGGNLCAPPGPESPRGDLQAALIAVDAQVRSTGADGERTESVGDFLASGASGRLLLDVSFGAVEAGSRAAVRRPHAHAYTILSVCAARVDGAVRIAASGAGPQAVRLTAAEEAFAGGDAAAAAERALEGVEPADDALASAWYRSKTLPVLVRRALESL